MKVIENKQKTEDKNSKKSEDEEKDDSSKVDEESNESNNESEKKNYENNFEEINLFLKYTAYDGCVDTDWEIMKSYIESKLNQIVETFSRKDNSNTALINSRVENIFKNIKEFKKPPFTVQRMCELLMLPNKHYKSLENFLFAFNKLVEI
jgi:hypothetical protein